MARKIDISTSNTIVKHGRVYFCRKCKGLFDESSVRIGKITRMEDGFFTYMCEKCAKKEINNEHGKS